MKKVLFALVALVIVLGLALPVQADVVPTIWTDKTDYAPEETVTIYGAGFEPGGQLTVEVTRPDGWVDAWSVTADDGGGFETAYLLDGIEGLYTVVATDGTNTATTTFTDKKRGYLITIDCITGGEETVCSPYDEPVTLPSPISLSGNASGTPYVGQYNHHYVRVDWGDGSDPESATTTEVTHDPNEKGFLWTWSSPSHEYATVGNNTITVTLYHSKIGGHERAVAQVTVTIEVVNAPPVANDDTAITNEDTPVTINVLDGDTDPDGDPLMVTAVSDPPHGSAVINLDYTITYTPDLNYNGADSFTYTLSDGTGSDTATVSITVNPVNDPPVADDDTATTDEDTDVDINVLDGDTDPDGDPLMVTAVSDPPHGSAVINLDYTITYTPDLNYNGADSFTYTLSDGTGSDTATVSITVNPVNDPPVADDDTATTDEDYAVTINVLANDSDVDGDTLSVDSVTQASNGTVTNNGTDVTYTPNTNFNGTDSFTYTASDGNGGTDTATVTVTVNPAPPPPPAPVYAPPVVVSIEVTPEEATIAVGGTQPFTATATYSDASTGNVTAKATWISSNNEVATIDTGLATGVAVGNTTITASLSGVTSNEATLEVTAAAFGVPVSIEVTPEEATIAVGGTQPFTATATYSGGSTADVTAEAIWVSSDTEVATVDAGLATGVAVGTTGITATLDGVTSDPAALSVTAVVSIEVTPEEATIAVGGTQPFTATATYSDGSTADVTGEADWDSSDTDVATINPEGVATGESEGTTEITATLDGVTSDPATLSVIAVVSIEVTLESDTIGVGETMRFTASATYSDGSTADVTGEADWDSSDTDVATIVAGLATGEGEGTTEITATLDGVTSDPATLTVTAPAALQWWAILAIIAALLALALLLFAMLRRRRGEEPEEAD